MLSFILNLDLPDKPSHIRHFEKSRNREAERSGSEIFIFTYIALGDVREIPLNSNSEIGIIYHFYVLIKITKSFGLFPFPFKWDQQYMDCIPHARLTTAPLWIICDE